MVDCEFFEIIDWNEETNEIYQAVCTLPSPTWPNCNRCQHKMEYKDVAAEVQEADMLGTYKPHVLLSSIEAELWRTDVEVLDGSINRQVRVNNDEDTEVHRLYHIWKSL